MKNYGMLYFSGSSKIGPFYESILQGHKRQTIKKFGKDGRDHVKVGRPVKLYWMVRTPKKAGEPHFIGYASVYRK